jgi:hypothetical protein
MGVMRRSSGSRVGLVSFGPAGGVDKEKVSWCPSCAKVGVNSQLKPRIYLDGKGNIKPPAADSKSWRQCWTCGEIVPVYAAQQEADIVTIAEPRTNPFNTPKQANSTEEPILPDTTTRKFDRTCKTQTKKKFKQDLELYKEEDLKDALRKGAKLLSYSGS